MTRHYHHLGQLSICLILSLRKAFQSYILGRLRPRRCVFQTPGCLDVIGFTQDHLSKEALPGQPLTEIGLAG
ncbi:hypothetical protein T265_10923 [Opisthorchis viverrini]|uniref:Uncharacterized protein n=1 Tax=Opisthorchis viverrini TaxID=6198 RepID=A0A074Z4U4_OPIVI|nr:hypothetical protein T265_10923 [Opisthorchis viverrini]KER20552.1 hypothetical protein T265_10923 [Opisthorchis viverrini]